MLEAMTLAWVSAGGYNSGGGGLFLCPSYFGLSVRLRFTGSMNSIFRAEALESPSVITSSSVPRPRWFDLGFALKLAPLRGFLSHLRA